jgi:hypothetical protein
MRQLIVWFAAKILLDAAKILLDAMKRRMVRGDWRQGCWVQGCSNPTLHPKKVVRQVFTIARV